MGLRGVVQCLRDMRDTVAFADFPAGIDEHGVSHGHAAIAADGAIAAVPTIAPIPALVGYALPETLCRWIPVGSSW